MSNSSKDINEKATKSKDKKKSQHLQTDGQTNNENKQLKSSNNNQMKESSKKTVKQETTNQVSVFNQETTKLKSNINQQQQQQQQSTLSLSQLNNKEFTTAPDIIQIKKFKGFKLFNHLQYQCDYSIIDKLPFDNASIHPAFIKLGLKYANQSICGSNARCLGFLNAFKEFIRDYKPSRDCRGIGKDLETKLKPNINFLAQCRPISVSMGNAIKEFKQILQYYNEKSESDLKKILFDEIDKFCSEKINLADHTISKFILAHEDVVISGSAYAKSKITNDDCILVYGYSSLVIQVIQEAHKKFPNFRVIIVDSRPKCSGKTTIEKLSKKGIDCTYILINAVSFVMKRVTKVIIGAHALLANGYVMGSVGSSQIALIAKAFNVPVVVCCETYKFCDKVQSDVFVNNELGNPNELKCNKTSIDNDNDRNINFINLVYDVTAPDLISCVVTDMGMLPCTSVPVVLRVKNRENLYLMQNNKNIKNMNAIENHVVDNTSTQHAKLNKWLNRNMKVKITDGRTLIGIFLCTDKDQNIILGSCQEFINSSENLNEGRSLGLAMVPGHHIISIDIDEKFDNIS